MSEFLEEYEAEMAQIIKDIDNQYLNSMQPSLKLFRKLNVQEGLPFEYLLDREGAITFHSALGQCNFDLRFAIIHLLHAIYQVKHGYLDLEEDGVIRLFQHQGEDIADMHQVIGVVLRKLEIEVIRVNDGRYLKEKEEEDE